MSELLKINVNDHTERKGNLTYLSWAWAWAEVLKIDPAASWVAHEWADRPAMFLPDGSAMVKVSVTVKGDTKLCVLPIMDNRNRAAGEDLPEGEKPEPNHEVLAQIAACSDVAALTALFKTLAVDARQLHMDAFTTRKKELA